MTYRMRWPDQPAVLNVGETVYQRAKGGVSEVAGQEAVARIYDDLAPGRWNNQDGRIEIAGTRSRHTWRSSSSPSAR